MMEEEEEEEAKFGAARRIGISIRRYRRRWLEVAESRSVRGLRKRVVGQQQVGAPAGGSVRSSIACATGKNLEPQVVVPRQKTKKRSN
jgi:hypothetical protein